MRAVASVFSWIGGIFTASMMWTNFSYVWIIPLIYTILDLSILVWRQRSVARGFKVACGVCTLLFCGLIGGILTLCIPEKQLGR